MRACGIMQRETAPVTDAAMRQFGPTRRNVSVIGQGTWYLDESDRRSAIAALRRGFDLGLNHIDTAELYGNGAAEEVIGEAIAWPITLIENGPPRLHCVTAANMLFRYATGLPNGHW